MHCLDLRVVSDLDSAVTAFLLNFPCFSYLALVVFVRAGISEDSSKGGLIIHLLNPITDAIKSYTSQKPWQDPVLGIKASKVNETWFLPLRNTGSNGRFDLDITMITAQKLAK